MVVSIFFSIIPFKRGGMVAGYKGVEDDSRPGTTKLPSLPEGTHAHTHTHTSPPAREVLEINFFRQGKTMRIYRQGVFQITQVSACHFLGSQAERLKGASSYHGHATPCHGFPHKNSVLSDLPL